MSFDLFETLDPFLISPEEKLFLSPGIAPQEAKLNVLFKLYVQLRNTKRILISIRKQCKQILVQIFFIRLPLGRQQNQKRKDRLCGWRKKMFRVSLQTFRPCLLSISHTHNSLGNESSTHFYHKIFIERIFCFATKNSLS